MSEPSAPSTENRPIDLCVNVDHVATLREARQASYPQPVAAARAAEEAGAAGITVHLREDRRHIQDGDVEELRKTVRGKLNLEIAATRPMLDIARVIRPDQVTLVPERPDEVTTEGGLDLVNQAQRIQRAASTLAREAIVVSVFIDPEPDQVAALAELSDVEAFEINTDAYTRAEEAARASQLDSIAQVARLGAEQGLRIYAGHGLTTDNVGPIAALAPIEELNIGHSIVSRSVMVGMRAAVEEMLAAIREGRSRRQGPER